MALLSDESIETRNRAAYSLVRWDWPDMQKQFQSMTQSEDLRRAGCASFILAKYYDQKLNGDVLDRYLESELNYLVGPPYAGTDNVVAIIQVLGQQGTRSSLSVLEKATTHRHRLVREASEKAVLQISSKK